VINDSDSILKVEEFTSYIVITLVVLLLEFLKMELFFIPLNNVLLTKVQISKEV